MNLSAGRSGGNFGNNEIGRSAMVGIAILFDLSELARHEPFTLIGATSDDVNGAPNAAKEQVHVDLQSKYYSPIASLY